MIKRIDEYLIQLKKELSGCDLNVIQEAILNSEEHLREALGIAYEMNPDSSESELLQEIIKKYGTPDEIAATYKEQEAIKAAFMSRSWISTNLMELVSTLFMATYFLGQGISLLFWNDMNAGGFEGLQGGYIFFTWALLCLTLGTALWGLAGYVRFHYYKRKKYISLIISLSTMLPFLAQGIALLVYWSTRPEGPLQKESGTALIISIISFALALILLVLWVWVVAKRHVSQKKANLVSPEISVKRKGLTLSIYLFLVFPLITASIALLFYWAAEEVEWERIGKRIALLIAVFSLELAFIPLLTWLIWIVVVKYQSLRRGQHVYYKKLKYLVVSIAILIAVFIFAGTFILLGHSFNHRGSATEGPVSEQWVARYNRSSDSYDYVHAMAIDDSGNVYVTGQSDYIGGDPGDYVTAKYDNEGNKLWVVYYNGPASSLDCVNDIAVDEWGNVYVTGESVTQGDFPYGSFNFNSVTVKYDSAGNQLWIASYSSPGADYDETTAIAVDGSGNVYVTGLGKGDGVSAAYITIKYDSNGDQLWVTSYTGPVQGCNAAHDIAVDQDGNVYVSGYSQGSDAEYDYDYATVKYDNDGNQLWVARYDGPASGRDIEQAIAIDDSGNVYVTGTSEGNGSDDDYATIKYDTNGNQLWVARYNGPSSLSDAAEDIALDESGNVYVTGHIYISYTNNNDDYATIKYDADGNQLWVACYNGPASGSDRAQAIAFDESSDNVYVTGYSQHSGEDENMDTDATTICYDTAGNRVWYASYNGPASGSDEAIAIAANQDGGIFVAGLSNGGDTDYDYMLIKYTKE